METRFTDNKQFSECNISFVGLGKLGHIAAETLATPHNSAEKHTLFTYDIDPKKGQDMKNPMDNVTRCESLEHCIRGSAKKNIIGGRDVVFIAVQTPHDEAYDGKEPTSHLPPKDFNYEHIIKVVKDVDDLVDDGTIIAVISTMLPGTVRKHIAPLVKNGRFVYNPYLIAQGTVAHDMINPEMIMLGTENGEEDEVCKKMYKVYDPLVAAGTRFEIGTWEEMEATKVFYNTFISTKLALANMIQDVAENVGHMNVDVVTDALKNSTKRIMGPSYMKAGFGDGGGCHPRDNIALRVLNERYNLGYDLFDSIMKAREEQAANMARYCLKYDMDVVILGKSFKPGLRGDTSGSPSMLVGWYVEKLGSKKVYYNEAPDEKAYTYLIHDRALMPEKFNPGSCIVDPYRLLEHDYGTKHCVIKHYGNTRPDEKKEALPPWKVKDNPTRKFKDYE